MNFLILPKKIIKNIKEYLPLIIAMLSVVAIGATSIVGYSLITGNTLGINIKSNNDSAGNIVNKNNSAKIDRGELPTLVQLATPTDAMQIPDIVEKVSPSVV